MDREDIPFLYAAQLSQLIERKELSPVEVTEAFLARIDDLDFKFNPESTEGRPWGQPLKKPAGAPLNLG